jgi:hypothetical protein
MFVACYGVYGAWRYALRQHTVKKEAETCVVVVRVEFSCRFGNPCCTPAYGGVEVHVTSIHREEGSASRRRIGSVVADRVGVVTIGCVVS